MCRGWLGEGELRCATQVQIEVDRQILRHVVWSGGKRRSRRRRESSHRSSGKLSASHRGRAESDKLGGSFHGVRVVHAAFMRRDGFNPRGQILQAPFREFKQRRSGGAMLRQLRDVELLANRSRFAELVESDHPGTALQRVEGPAQGGQQSGVFWRHIEIDTRRGCVAQHLARFCDEDLTHLDILRKLVRRQRGRQRLYVGRLLAGGGLARQIEVQREHRLTGSHRRLGDGQHAQADRPGGGGHKVDQRFRQVTTRSEHVGRVRSMGKRLAGGAYSRHQQRLVRTVRLLRETRQIAHHVFGRHILAR